MNNFDNNKKRKLYNNNNSLATRLDNNIKQKFIYKEIVYKSTVTEQLD